MEKLTEVLAMGGYGAFVWPSYACAAMVLISLLITSRRGLNHAQRALNQIETAGRDET